MSSHQFEAWCSQHQCHLNDCWDSHNPTHPQVSEKGLRLVELYKSIQGEGPRVGEQTVFVRFGGCNFRCPLWPCDTQYAIQPKLWRNSPVVSPRVVATSVRAMGISNVCLTGGEPTMQPAEALQELALMLLQDHTIDVFTNGSLREFPQWMQHEDVRVVLDWKLPGSGEADHSLEQRIRNVATLRYKDVVKFTVASLDDLDYAIEVWERLHGRITKAQYYVGVAWGKLSEAELIEKVMESGLPWKVNVQVHKYVYGAEATGV
jgi:7-carboxy-7-deazaguanine synthase